LNIAKSRVRPSIRHEFRTPLNAIKGYGELLVEEIGEGGSKTLLTDLGKVLDLADRLLGDRPHRRNSGRAAARYHRQCVANYQAARRGRYPSSGIAAEAEQRGVGWRARERMRDGAMHRSIADNLPINRSAWPTLRKRRCWRARSPCRSAPY
jgi:hypothetical protein